jgi:hypothetical protein
MLVRPQKPKYGALHTRSPGYASSRYGRPISSPADSSRCIKKVLVQASESSGGALAPRHDHEIAVARDIGSGSAKNLPEYSLDAVPYHSAADFPRNGEPQSIICKLIGPCEKYELSGIVPAAGVV